MARILILDDEQPLLQSLSMELKRGGHECLLAETGQEAMQHLTETSPDLAILDMQLPDMSGMVVLRRLRAELPEVPVIVITAYASVDTAVEAMKEGALDYIEKPLDLEEISLVVERELTNARLRSDVEAFRRQARHGEDDPLLGESPPMVRLRQVVQEISGVEEVPAAELPTLLLEGEVGTGKSLLARHIHRRSALAARPFVRLNCSGVTGEQAELELFGCEAGAIEPASPTYQGLFEVAQGGTVLLDEVGELAMDCQARLLRILDEGQMVRIGGTRRRPVSVRLLASSSTSLAAAVDDGSFRADLYYRLKVVRVELPPLRKRREDIPALAAHFLRKASTKYHKMPLELHEDLLDHLMSWEWPGNVRELAHTMEGMALTGELPEFHRPGGDVADPVGPAEIQFDFTAHPFSLEAVEKRLVRDALKHTGGNVSETARLLGLTRGALRHRLERWDMRSPA